MNDKNKRLLIVDDQDATRKSIGSVLKSEGWRQIDYASSAEEALESITRAAPDLVIMDTDMAFPGLKGYEACERIRGMSEGENIAIVGMSGESYDLQWNAARADAFYMKPIPPADLNGIANEAIAKRDERMGYTSQS